MYQNAFANSDIPNAESIVVNNVPTAACRSVNENDPTAEIEGCRLSGVVASSSSYQSIGTNANLSLSPATAFTVKLKCVFN